MERLRKRAEFKMVAGGTRVTRKGFVLQAQRRPPEGDDKPRSNLPRFGFTVTRKTGNAVVRNRIKRRLREAVHLIGGAHAANGTDYVLIGRRTALNEPFERLLADLASSLDAIVATRRPDDRTDPERMNRTDAG